MLICLDPGHGGKDSGAVYDGSTEKNLNLLFAAEVSDILRTKHEIKFTHVFPDDYLTPTQRANIANEAKADIFISLHHNASEFHRANGIEILYYPYSRKGIILSSSILKKIKSVCTIKIRGIKPGWYRGKVGHNLPVLSKTKMPAILIEAFFLDGNLDREVMCNANLMRKHYRLIGEAIKEALDECKNDLV